MIKRETLKNLEISVQDRLSRLYLLNSSNIIILKEIVQSFFEDQKLTVSASDMLKFSKIVRFSIKFLFLKKIQFR